MAKRIEALGYLKQQAETDSLKLAFTAAQGELMSLKIFVIKHRISEIDDELNLINARN